MRAVAGWSDAGRRGRHSHGDRGNERKPGISDCAALTYGEITVVIGEEFQDRDSSPITTVSALAVSPLHRPYAINFAEGSDFPCRPSACRTLIRPSGTFSRGEKG